MNLTSEESLCKPKGVFHATVVQVCVFKLFIPKLLMMLTAKAVQEEFSWNFTSRFSLLFRADTLVIHHFLFLDKNVMQGARTGLWMSSFLSV